MFSKTVSICEASNGWVIVVNHNEGGDEDNWRADEFVATDWEEVERRLRGAFGRDPTTARGDTAGCCPWD